MKKFFSNQKYDYSKAWRMRHILPDKYILAEVRLRPDQVTKPDCPTLDYHKNRRCQVARAVFMRFIEMVVDDMIQNNSSFVSPNMDYFTLKIRKCSDPKTRHLLEQSGTAYQDVNIFRSDGQVYEMVLQSKALPFPTWQVRISHAKYKQVVRNVNNGKRYFDR